ncbi:MAG: Ig domain-containing protein, partial [Prevotellaceae bacterium]|nr:Ig domain-containing protein [Prevotellaceae bacterium]
DADGKVTAVSQGKATITVRSTDGSDISATCEVTVVRLVSGILLSESEVNLIEGESLRITATVLPENATDTSLRWYSLDEVIATVDDGLIYAMAPGETTIVAEATDGSGVRAECHVVVEDADGIGSIAGGVSILVQQGCIVVSGLPAGESVKVYSINGTNIFHARSQGSDIVIRPDGKGVYVVVLGTQSYKVIVH